jgi:SAM-dependent methyltransferase
MKAQSAFDGPQAPRRSPLADPGAWDLVAADYAAEVVPIFEPFAREALRLAGVARGMRVVDVAAGPGTLAFLAARLGAAVSALDFSPVMVAQLKARMALESVRGVAAEVGDGMALPYADAAFDAGFSMFGLMFFPDRSKGYRELHRVVKPGARIVVSSWPPVDRTPLMGALFAALADLTPGPQAPSGPMPLSEPDVIEAEMAAAGFGEIAVREVSSAEEASSMAALLDSLIRTMAPVALLRRRLGTAWPAAEKLLRDRLTERFGPGPQRFELVALLGVATRP